MCCNVLCTIKEHGLGLHKKTLDCEPLIFANVGAAATTSLFCSWDVNGANGCHALVGTCSWAPFVLQTIAMLRDHEHDYELGPGYHKDKDGSDCEVYWVRRKPQLQTSSQSNAASSKVTSASEVPNLHDVTVCGCHVLRQKRPYRIELVGVTCDPQLAVARGFWRKLHTGRAVPVEAQLRSHRLFAKNWPQYCKVLDSATLYHTGEPSLWPCFYSVLRHGEACMRELCEFHNNNPTSTG